MASGQPEIALSLMLPVRTRRRKKIGKRLMRQELIGSNVARSCRPFDFAQGDIRLTQSGKIRLGWHSWRGVGFAMSLGLGRADSSRCKAITYPPAANFMTGVIVTRSPVLRQMFRWNPCLSCRLLSHMVYSGRTAPSSCTRSS